MCPRCPNCFCCIVFCRTVAFQRVCLNPPIKTLTTDEQAVFGGRLEAVRKDVEIFFGYLKARFRILKQHILYRTEENIHHVFFACCILHNMLYAHDGLDEVEPESN